MPHKGAKNGSELSSFVLQQSRLDSKMECLQLTMTEVLKRQNSKSKKGYNQVRLRVPLHTHICGFKMEETDSLARCTEL